MLLNKLSFPKFKKKINFADFYRLVTEGRRASRAKQAASSGDKKPVRQMRSDRAVSDPRAPAK